MRHANRIAVVTGAGRGIGQAYALRLASEGADIAVADVRPAEETVARIKEQGRRAIGVACDVSDPAAVANLAREVEAAFGRCDILVNNAGLIPNQSFDDITFDDWRRIMATNLDGVFLMAKAFVPGMKARGFGRIINIASNTFAQMAPGLTHYIASKGGVIGFTRALATDLGTFGITVNAIAPGFTRTPGTEALSGYRGLSQAEIYDAIAKKQAIQRPERPDDLVGAMSFLASEDSAFITGQTLYVDGGLVRV